MKVTLAFATVLAATMTVGAAAQYGNPPSASSKDKDSKDVTVTGCLMSGAPSGTTGTTGSTTASAAGQFFLANATVKTEASSSTAAPSPTAESTPPATPPTTPPATPPSAGATAGTTGSPASDQSKLRLVGGEKSKLESLVNHQVEIKGRFEGESPSAATTTAPTGAAMSGGMGRPFHVSSIKEIAATCSPSQK